jgi:TonB family protein
MRATATSNACLRCARPWTGAALLAVLLAACGGESELEQPVPLYGEEPIEYPLELWDEGVEGAILLRLRVTEMGEVDSVEVAESSGHAELDSAAVKGARRLRFEPGRKDGKRVRMWANVPVEFSTRPRADNQD